MQTNPWPRIAVALAVMIAAMALLSNLTPDASNGLRDFGTLAIGFAFIGWIAWLALTANRKRG